MSMPIVFITALLFTLYISAYSLPFRRPDSPDAQTEAKDSVKFLWNKDDVEICVSLIGQLCWYCPCAPGLKCSMNVCAADTDNELTQP